MIEDWDHPEESGSSTTQADDEIAKEATNYYRWLYQKKQTSQEATEKMLGILGEDKIPAHITQKTEGGISEENVISAIRATGTGKSPGPDGLPSSPGKVYHFFAVGTEAEPNAVNV